MTIPRWQVVAVTMTAMILFQTDVAVAQSTGVPDAREMARLVAKSMVHLQGCQHWLAQTATAHYFGLSADPDLVADCVEAEIHRDVERDHPADYGPKYSIGLSAHTVFTASVPSEVCCGFNTRTPPRED